MVELPVDCLRFAKRPHRGQFVRPAAFLPPSLLAPGVSPDHGDCITATSDISILLRRLDQITDCNAELNCQYNQCAVGTTANQWVAGGAAVVG
jgi:hypothetical protein